MVNQIYCYKVFIFSNYRHHVIWTYSHDPKFMEREIWANIVDPDQTALKKKGSHQGLHCVQLSVPFGHYVC